MSVKWSEKVNQNFFGLSNSVNENTETVTFESGKKRTFLKNSTPIKNFSFSLLFWNKQEQIDFWDWYENELLSGSESFVIKDILRQDRNTEYKMTSVPKVDEGSYPKKCQISVEEA